VCLGTGKGQDFQGAASAHRDGLLSCVSPLPFPPPRWIGVFVVGAVRLHTATEKIKGDVFFSFYRSTSPVGVAV
jgi:hypothetical protein